MRRFPLALLLTLAVPLAACGDDPASRSAGPPGSPDNPLKARKADSTKVNEGRRSGPAASKPPGYAELLKRQSTRPRTRFTPCSLVTRAQAGAIVGAAVLAPIEAPQGPTCIYRTRAGDQFITLAVQPLGLDRARRQLSGRRRVEVAGRTAYCGRQGAPVLYARFSPGRVLSVAAPCEVARQFAARAVAG
jgi:hypothetical protein